MHRRGWLAIVVFGSVATGTIGARQAPAPFQPWPHDAYAFVNAVAFSPDDARMYHASFLARVAAHRGETLPAGAPELGIFESVRRSDGSWGEPALVSFSGRFKDYEPTLAPDGSFMIFNSWRPLPGQPANVPGRNNLWLSRRTPDGGWGDPVSLAAINRPDTEESYSAITADGRVFYLQEVPRPGGAPDYDIYVSRLTGEVASSPRPVRAAALPDHGESDPWVAPDGSYLIFTRWPLDAEWNRATDLYITFANGDDWTPAEPFLELNTEGRPDYSITITSGADARIYWRRGGSMVSAAAAPLIAAARARAGAR
jgi:hypothetical protein